MCATLKFSITVERPTDHIQPIAILPIVLGSFYCLFIQLSIITLFTEKALAHNRQLHILAPNSSLHDNNSTFSPYANFVYLIIFLYVLPKLDSSQYDCIIQQQHTYTSYYLHETQNDTNAHFPMPFWAFGLFAKSLIL